MEGGEQNMRKLLIVLLVLVALTLSGCILTDWLVPETMEANVDAVLTAEGTKVAWSIENIGDVDIFKYIITFNVSYPFVVRDNVLFQVTDYGLDAGDKHEGIIELLAYGETTPDTVSVTLELPE